MSIDILDLEAHPWGSLFDNYWGANPCRHYMIWHRLCSTVCVVTVDIPASAARPASAQRRDFSLITEEQVVLLTVELTEFGWSFILEDWQARCCSNPIESEWAYKSMSCANSWSLMVDIGQQAIWKMKQNWQAYITFCFKSLVSFSYDLGNFYNYDSLAVVKLVHYSFVK